MPAQAARGCRSKNSVPFSRLSEADAPGAASKEAQGEIGAW